MDAQAVIVDKDSAWLKSTTRFHNATPGGALIMQR